MRHAYYTILTLLSTREPVTGKDGTPHFITNPKEGGN